MASQIPSRYLVKATNTAATTGIISVNMNNINTYNITPTGVCTFNAVGGSGGQSCTFIITTSGTTAFVLTWGTNFKTAGTLSTGIVTGKVFCVTFVCKDGTLWVETSRTTAL